MEAYPDAVSGVAGASGVLHLDLYRLADPLELEQLGLEDHAPPAWFWLVEWPARGAGGLLPADLRLELAYAEPGRSAKLQARGAAGEHFINGLRELVPDHIK